MDIVDDVDMFFTNETEMDATVRVVQLLLVVCKDIYDSTQQRYIHISLYAHSLGWVTISV